MATKWTDEQRQAIDTRGKNLLISAAAGSGKTAVLVERIVNLLIEERISIDNMLIVTFTNAAAGEMKERIQRRLKERQSENLSRSAWEVDRELADFLSKQIQNVPRATISTVHSFCIGIIRDNFSLAGIDPAFKLVNEVYGSILREEAIDIAFEKKYDEQDEKFERLVAGYGESKGDSKLRELVQSIDRFVQAQPYPVEWLNAQRDFYKELAEQPSLSSAMAFLEQFPIGEKLREWVFAQMMTAKNALDTAWDEVEGKGLSFEDKLFVERERIHRLCSLLDESLADFFDALEVVTFERFTKKKNELEDEDWKYIQALRNDAKKVYNDLSKDKPILHTKIFLSDMNYLSEMMDALIDLVLDYRNEYATLKKANAVLDFSDLEHLALEILKDESVRQSLQSKFQYIFYDEYQDTNLVQETIVNAIKQEDNLFFVGDVKQSIYRFRLADPTIFNHKYALYEQELQSEKIDLSKNFRSRKEVLAFCNLIFKEIMTVQYGEVEYKNPSHQLYAGRVTSDASPERKDSAEGEISDALENQVLPSDVKNVFAPYADHIELVVIEKSKKQYKLVPDDASGNEIEISTEKKVQAQSISLEREEAQFLERDDFSSETEEIDKTAIELEAIFTAQKIRELVSKGIAYKDIAILFRSVRGKASIFEKALADIGIPSYIDYSSSHYDKLEIKCLIDYLKIVDNKKQDEALIGVMSSMFGGFDNEELIQIRAHYPSGNFYLAAESYAKEDDALGEKLRRFYKKLSADMRREKMTALPDFIWYVAENSGFNTYISGLDDALQRLHNIKSLVEKAREYEQSESLGLFGFLRHIDSLLKGKVDGGDSTILESENVVRIMSIHKSKGLEFNTVFVCDLAKRINEQDLNADVIMHNDLGIGLRYKNADLGVKSDNALRIILKNQKQREGISEEIRILYVALTRAVDRLYLVASVRDLEKFAAGIAEGSIDKNILKSRSYLSWIANVLIREKNGEILRNLAGVDMPLLSDKDSEAKYGIRLLKGDELLMCSESEPEILLNELALEPSPQSRNLFERYQYFEYPFEEQTKNSVKTSVTELTKEYKNRVRELEQSFSVVKRPCFVKSDQFSASELGTIVHFLMENIPIRRYDALSLEAEIEKMVAIELLTEKEASVIPRKAIVDFFESELGHRMIKADKVYREQSFLMQLGGALVEGIIDCYFTEGDEIVILDYKTDVRIDFDKHREQLFYYKQAVEAMEKKKVKAAYIYWISHNEFTQIL